MTELTIPSPENSGLISNPGSLTRQWIRKREDIIKDTPSRRDSMCYDREIRCKQDGCDFIHHICNTLFVKKRFIAPLPIPSITSVLCGATILFHRFFTVYSLKTCDVRDVAAACVFLAIKTEVTTMRSRYLAKIVLVQQYPSKAASVKMILDKCDVLHYLEEVVLKAIGFDLNIILPHPYVLKLMGKIKKEDRTDIIDEVTKTAYFLATELLILTDWTVRYSSPKIASACLNIASTVLGVNLSLIIPFDIEKTWYQTFDDTLTHNELQAMTNEILNNSQIVLSNLKDCDHYTFQSTNVFYHEDITISLLARSAKSVSQVSGAGNQQGPAEAEIQKSDSEGQENGPV